MADDQQDKITMRDVLVALGYVVAVALNAYLIADQITDGESSRQLSLWWLNTRAKWKQAISLEDELQKSTPHMLFEAITIVEDAQNGN